MSEKLVWDGPVKAYLWGPVYEVRDRVNRVVIRATTMKGDLVYRKKLAKLIHVLVGLMNGQKWIEQSNDGFKLQGFGNDGLTVTEMETITPLPVQVLPEIDLSEAKEEPKNDEAESGQEEGRQEVLNADQYLKKAVEETTPDPEDEEYEGTVGGEKSKPVLEHQKKKRGRPFKKR